MYLYLCRTLLRNLKHKIFVLKANNCRISHKSYRPSKSSRHFSSKVCCWTFEHVFWHCLQLISSVWCFNCMIGLVSWIYMHSSPSFMWCSMYYNSFSTREPWIFLDRLDELIFEFLISCTGRSSSWRFFCDAVWALVPFNDWMYCRMKYFKDFAIFLLEKHEFSSYLCKMNSRFSSSLIFYSRFKL